VRLRRLGIEPTFAADHGLSISVYYDDPDGNVVELNVYNYADPRTAAEHLRLAPPTRSHVDLEKLLAARNAGASSWNLHERAVAGEFAPEKPFDPR
jgi:catechol-2,3-dioxygenase